MTIDTVAQYAPLLLTRSSNWHLAAITLHLLAKLIHLPHCSALLQRGPMGRSHQCPRATWLAGKMTFSPAFQAALGTANVTDIHGLENMLTLEDVFEALLEREASHQFCAGRNSSLQALMGIKESVFNGFWFCWE